MSAVCQQIPVSLAGARRGEERLTGRVPVECSGRDLGSLVDGAENLVHLGAEAAKLSSVEPGEFLEVGSALVGGRDEDSACVIGIGLTFDEAVFDRAANEFSRRVKAKMELFGDVGE